MSLRSLDVMRLQLMLNVSHHSMLCRRVLVMTLVGIAACGARDHAPASDAESRAASIERELPTLRRDSGTVSGLSTEGATIDAAYRGAQLRRLAATFFGETGRAHETYYFDSTLFLVIRRDAQYDAPLSGDVRDSTITRYDLTRRDTPPARADSLNAGARALLDALAGRTK
ncbi:MAG: hypothetical protein IPN16_24575 [Gemmatimonadetes bacterium]|nr:hypothetical protein [Gemmatimonadota bacterium]